MLARTTTAVLALPAAALAQPAITFDVENPVLRPGESTTVTMYAGYGGTDYAIAGVETNLVTSVGSRGWSDWALLPPLLGPGTNPGVASATGVDGILGGQLHFLGAMIYADPINPAPLWRGTYTAPGDASVPFAIDLSTMTTRYDIYISFSSSASVSRLADLTEGAATIRVIPAPASALVLALGAVALRRRR